MFCNKCGAENPEGGAFCQKCGASLKAAAAKAAPTKSADMETVPKASVGDVIKALPIQTWLMYGAMAALGIALLVGILNAAGAGDYAKGSAKAAMFFDALLQGILVAGVLAGFSALIGSRKK